jgi:DNA-binding transcriptional ArsR family regulator
MVVGLVAPSPAVDRVFHALADATRRDIVVRTLQAEHSLSALARLYPMSFAAVQKHVAVLERAELVTKRRRGREQLVTGNVEYRALRPWRGLPVAVVSPTPGWGWPGGWPDRAIAEASNFWSEMQGQLVYQWPGATQLTARYSGHDVEHADPEAIVTALGTILAPLERSQRGG